MLSGVFKEQIQDIFKFLPNDTQVCLFSATLPDEVLELTQQFMRDPVKILVKQEDVTLKGINQFYIPIDKQEWKMDVLINLYSQLEFQQAIIFCNSKKSVEELEQAMTEQEFK